jgi:hypothetical protein
MRMALRCGILTKDAKNPINIAARQTLFNSAAYRATRTKMHQSPAWITNHAAAMNKTKEDPIAKKSRSRKSSEDQRPCLA